MSRIGDRARGAGIAVMIGVVTALLAVAPVAHAKVKKKSEQAPSISAHWVGVPGGDRVVEVYGLNGDIRATHSENETLYVYAVKRGVKSDPDEVQIEFDSTTTGVRICARYPRPSGALNDCGPDQDVKRNDVIVDFALKVPAGARLIAHTVNGSIGGDDMQGPVEASTVEGGISIVSTHRVTAKTVDGSIDVMMGPLGWGSEPMSYTTTNGSVLLRIPSFVDASIDARTTSGHITCSLAGVATEHSDRQHLAATMGKGGTRLTLETVNGYVELLPP